MAYGLTGKVQACIRGVSVAFCIACYGVQAFSTNVNDIAVSFHLFRIQRVESRNSAKR